MEDLSKTSVTEEQQSEVATRREKDRLRKIKERGSELAPIEFRRLRNAVIGLLDEVKDEPAMGCVYELLDAYLCCKGDEWDRLFAVVDEIHARADEVPETSGG